ncbi:MAG: peptide-methionine (R)-S-oxide reductase MsrB [Candidatus Thermoplasmatota archaeon]|nr:peptide-methionine (R)-S-oxide reductase MsrB [Candidatus Thermoplasmatota archaeon]
METEPTNSQMDGGSLMKAVMSFSGGMDSTGLLLHLLSRGYSVNCISFDYGQKHVIEIERAKANIDYLAGMGITVEHEVVDLRSAMGIFHSALTTSGYEIPEGHYEEEQMKDTVVPNRNAIFTSVLYGYALSLAAKEGTEVEIALGVHSGDHAIYPDCRPEFYEAVSSAFALGNWDSDRVSLQLPYIESDKEGILRDSIQSCNKLGLDFDTVFANTNTSYNPDSEGRSSGTSGADVERILAFHAIGRKDPVEYVDDWSNVLDWALKAELRHHVMKRNGTERPFTGEYDKHYEVGSYNCADCGLRLFESESKFDSGCGWPAFSEEAEGAGINQLTDLTHGMRRIEVRCSGCDSHLGHLFHESRGPRYCINSICLEFEEGKK